MISRWGGYLGQPGGPSVNYKGPYKGRRETGGSESEKERGNGSRGWSDVGGTKSQGIQTLKARKGKEMNSTLKASEETCSPANPLWTSDLLNWKI